MRYPAPIPPILSYARPHTVRTRRESALAKAWQRTGMPFIFMALTSFSILIISIHLALVFAGLFAARLGMKAFRRYQHRRELKRWARLESAGVCLFCHYDLRGSPTRCPERGEEPPELYRQRLHREMWPSEATVPRRPRTVSP